MNTQTPRSQHAIIIGSSLAGLLTARVLSQHFRQVTLIERDRINDQPEARKGQPHTRHLHGLLAKGLETMSHYFPGLVEDLVANGAQVADIPWQLAVGEDFRFAETEGAKPAGTDFVNRYVNRVHRASHHDPVVYTAFLKVMNLMAAPTSLFHPRILWRTLRGGGERRVTPATLRQSTMMLGES